MGHRRGLQEHAKALNASWTNSNDLLAVTSQLSWERMKPAIDDQRDAVIAQRFACSQQGGTSESADTSGAEGGGLQSPRVESQSRSSGDRHRL